MILHSIKWQSHLKTIMPHIPVEEFEIRVRNAQHLMEEQNIDILFSFGNEAEPYYQKYFSNYWPSFESAAVIFGRNRSPLLLVGPESMERAKNIGVISNIRKLTAFRESASPAYFDSTFSSMEEVIAECLDGEELSRLSIAGSRILPFDIYSELVNAASKFGAVEILCDSIVDELRTIKSANELSCIQQACNISVSALDYLLSSMHVGLTELQAKGIALAKMYELGAEGEAYPFWILTGTGNNYAIGRSGQRKICAGDIVQLQLGARYGGYASSVARPVIMGAPCDWTSRAIDALREGESVLLDNLKAGASSRKVAEAFNCIMKKNGHYGNLIYGPCHSLGISECEGPWVEEQNDFELKEGMTFGLDLYLDFPKTQHGIRLEDTACVGKNCGILMTKYSNGVIAL